MKKVILTKEDLNKYAIAFKQANKHLYNRLMYIFKFIEKTYSITACIERDCADLLYLDYFQNNSENDYEYCYEHICFFSWGRNDNTYFIDKNNEIWNIDISIPTRWLTEDFEKELIDGKKLYDEKIKKEVEENLIKRQIADEKLQKTIKSALKKLTKEERAALKMDNAKWL